jgi:8-oxo-dGTP pyrophosphatase MutT (NUDIX family)
VNCVARHALTVAHLESPEVVQAAGGLLVRRVGTELQIALIHRPAQSDWSFPKGKLEGGETYEEAAQREVQEETGLSGRLLRFVGHTEYTDRKGRPKVVAYWVMAAESGSFAVNEEVDELRWLDLPAAGRLLSYSRDRELLTIVAAADQVEPFI